MSGICSVTWGRIVGGEGDLRCALAALACSPLRPAHRVFLRLRDTGSHGLPALTPARALRPPRRRPIPRPPRRRPAGHQRAAGRAERALPPTRASTGQTVSHSTSTGSSTTSSSAPADSASSDSTATGSTDPSSTTTATEPRRRRLDVVWSDVVWFDVAWFDVAWFDVARCGFDRFDVDWFGSAGSDRVVGDRIGRLDREFHADHRHDAGDRPHGGRACACSCGRRRARACSSVCTYHHRGAGEHHRGGGPDRGSEPGRPRPPRRRTIPHPLSSPAGRPRQRR